MRQVVPESFGLSGVPGGRDNPFGYRLARRYARCMNADAVQAADRHVLVRYAAAVAENARSLLEDAEFLLAAGRWARAHSLAILAREEWAKAYSVLTLSLMSQETRSRLSARDLKAFLEGHQLKNMGAHMLRLVNGAQPGVASRVAGMAGLADELRAAEAQAGEANLAKQRGLYADLLADGTLSLPSSVSKDEAERMIEQAREVSMSAALLHDPAAIAALASPPPEAVALSDALFGSMLASLQQAGTADGVATVIQDVASRLASTEADPPT